MGANRACIGKLGRLVGRFASILAATLCALLICGCGPEDGNFSLSARSELQDAVLTVTSPAEYSDIVSSPLEYLSCSDPDVTLETDDVIDTSQVGDHDVSIRMSKGFFDRTELVDIPVQDTRPPQIELTESAYELEVGYDFDPTEHVASALDPVDGALSPVEVEPDRLGDEPGISQVYEYGWYQLTSDVDTTTAGTYSMQVVAADQHGNTSAAELPVMVTDPLEGVTLDVDPELGFLEYSNDSIDPTTLATCSDEEATVAADTLTPNQVGELTAQYQLSKHRSVHEVEVPLMVKDTQPPALRLRQWKIKVQLGEEFDPKSYVKYAKDPVDGYFKMAAKKPSTKATKVGEELFYDKGFYCFEGEVDTKTPGTYKVEVIACDKHGNATSKHYQVTVVDPLANVKLTPKSDTLEYSRKKVDPAKLVTCSVGGATVTADKLSLAKPGKKKVTYTVTKGNSTHTVDVTFTVKDTKKPVISLSAQEATINEYGSFSLSDYLTSVKDPVDGDLPQVSSVPADNGDGWYQVDGYYNTHSAGKYFLTITACDRHGNRATKEFALTVKDPYASTGGGGSSSTAHDYVLNTSTGKFHYPSCRDVKRMKDWNRQDVTMTRDDVIARGYSPCGHCNP